MSLQASPHTQKVCEIINSYFSDNPVFEAVEKTILNFIGFKIQELNTDC